MKKENIYISNLLLLIEVIGRGIISITILYVFDYFAYAFTTLRFITFFIMLWAFVPIFNTLKNLK